MYGRATLTIASRFVRMAPSITDAATSHLCVGMVSCSGRESAKEAVIAEKPTLFWAQARLPLSNYRGAKILAGRDRLIEEKGPLVRCIECIVHNSTRHRRPPEMRLKVGRLGRVVKRDLPIELGREQLTSCGELELLPRYFQLIGLTQRLRRGFREHQLGGDYGCAHLVLLVIALLVVGARRLQHLRYVAADALFARLCGLARIPSDRTVVNWLKQFTQASLRALARVNKELLHEQNQPLHLRPLTIDVDGTVIRTGGKVAWAMRGFNPHHPKDPSYYPLLAHLAQTGQILRLKNRPGNVHDSKGRCGLRARTDRGDPRAPGALATARIPHGRGIFPARSAQAARSARLLLRHQGALLQVDRDQGPGRCPAAVDPGRFRGQRLRDPT